MCEVRKVKIRHACGTIVKMCLWIGILCSIAEPMGVFAKATLVTLPDLTKESQVIVFGRVEDENTDSESSASSDWLRFAVGDVLKGAFLVHDGAVPLCNTRPSTEWPDLSKLTGQSVLFLLHSPKKDCFNLSHNYRSVIRINNNEVDTLVVEGEPAKQSLDTFLRKVRSLVSRGY